MQELGRVTREERAEALLYAEALEDPWGDNPTRPDGRLMCGHAPEQHPTEADASRCRDRGW
jgi:hypothetical protein